MKKESLLRVRESVSLLLPQASETTRLFYDRLFEIAPETRGLFKIDMDLQRQHFSAALAVILKNLTMLDVLTEPLRQLGLAHTAIGVEPHQYALVRDAILYAMGRTLGDVWTPELAGDWQDLLERISGIMMNAGTQSQLPPRKPTPRKG